MPVEVERELRKEAARRGYTGERADRFVYGTMTNMGWRKGQGMTKKKKKGKKK